DEKKQKQLPGRSSSSFSPHPSSLRRTDAPPMLLEKKERHGRAARATNNKPKQIRRNGLWYDIPSAAEKTLGQIPKRQKTPRPKLKNDPILIAKARELNGRWLELINNDPSALPQPCGKYAICKQNVGATLGSP